MLLNNVELEVKKIKKQEKKTLSSVAKEIGVYPQAITHVLKESELINRSLTKVFEYLGYDIRLKYVKREGAGKNEKVC